MNRLSKAGFVGVVAITLTATAAASGPKWTEMGDAGELPGGANQITMGIGLLRLINGNLGMATLTGEIDLVDMFLINIVDPENFRVTTDPDDKIGKGMAFAQFDTQLWLFQPNPANPLEALGIVGNDDHFELGGQFSLLLRDPTDSFTGGGVVSPGLYYIAITRSNHDPFSAGGDIFLQADPQEISGPDGPGKMSHVIGWAGDPGGAFAGDYRMALQGVGFAEIPAPGALSLLGLASLTMRRRRRR